MTSVLFIIGLMLPMLMACAAFAGLLRGRMMRFALLGAPLPAFLTALRVTNAGSVHIGDWTFTMDVSGAMLMGSAALLWIAAGVFVSRGVLGNEGFRRFCGCWFLTMTGSLGVFVAADLIGFLTMYALASLPAYGMVTHDGTPTVRRAGAAYLGCSLAGETMLVSGFVLLAMNSPGHSLIISDAVAALPDSPWKHLTLALLIGGFAMKMGLVPMHFWLPLAHPAAPAAGSAVLSGAIIKAGVIGLVRFLPLDTPMPDWGLALAWAGLITALYGVVVGMTQEAGQDKEQNDECRPEKKQVGEEGKPPLPCGDGDERPVQQGQAHQKDEDEQAMDGDPGLGAEIRARPKNRAPGHRKMTMAERPGGSDKVRRQ